MSDREHFDSSLGVWTAVTQGSVSVNVSDSQVAFIMSGGSAPQGGGIYRAMPHGSNHIFAACVRNALNVPAVSLRVFHTATPPVCAPNATLNTIELFNFTFQTVGTRRPRVNYREPSGTAQFWNDSGLAWTTSPVVGSIPSGQNDSSVVLGYQWDVTNSRARFFIIGAGSGTTQIEACGPKLFCLTDWVPFASIRDSSSSTLWITLGKFANDAAHTGSCFVDWTRLEDGPKRFAGANQATVGASPYSIKLWESYGSRFWLPSGSSPQRTSIITQAGTQPWCSQHTQMGAGVLENDGTMWLFFNGKSVQWNSVGVTKSTDGGVTWTPFAGNPIVQQQTGTDLQNCGNVSVIKDESEPDANKRYKLFLSFSGADGNWRIFLYTASHPEAGWTQQGTIAVPDGDSPTGYRLHMNPIFVNGEWLMISESGWRWRGTQLAIGSLTKEPFSLGLAQQNVSQVPTALSSTSRTVTVPNSAGFVQDAMVLIDDDTNPGEWAINRVRKNVSGTQFELYELTPGYAPPATLVNRYDAGNVSLHGVYFDPDRSEWCWYLSFFQVTNVFNNGGAIAPNNLQTTGLAVSSGPLVAPTIVWFDTPQTWLARDGNTGTCENMKFFDPPITTGPPPPPPPPPPPDPFWLQRLKMQGPHVPDFNVRMRRGGRR